MVKEDRPRELGLPVYRTRGAGEVARCGTPGAGEGDEPRVRTMPLMYTLRSSTCDPPSAAAGDAVEATAALRAGLSERPRLVF